MFKLFNDYPLNRLMKKVQTNARIMFAIYAALIISGGICAVFIAMDRYEIWMLLPVFLGGGLSLFAPFLLYDYFHNKRDKYSVFGLSAEDCRLLDRKIRESERLGDRLGVSDEYIFSMKSSFYIPVALPMREVEAAYFTRYRRKGVRRHSANVAVITTDGVLYRFPLGYKLLCENAADELVLSRIQAHAPEALVGIKNGRRQSRDLRGIEPIETGDVKW